MKLSSNSGVPAPRGELWVIVTGTMPYSHLLREIFYLPLLRDLEHEADIRGIRLRTSALRQGDIHALPQYPAIVLCVIDHTSTGVDGWYTGSPQQKQKTFPWDSPRASARDQEQNIAMLETLVQVHAHDASQIFFYELNSERGGGNRTRSRKSGAEHGARIRSIIERVQEYGALPVRTGHQPSDLYPQMHNDVMNVLEGLAGSHQDYRTLSVIRESHDTCAARHVAPYVPVPALFEQIDNHIAKKSGPLLIIGGPGYGKTALVANWCIHYQGLNPEALIIRHFVEVNGRDSDHGPLLRHILMEINDVRENPRDLPETVPEMEQEFSALLAAGSEREIVVVIDGMNLLCARSRLLYWLPRDLPANVRLVVTSVPEDVESAVSFSGWDTIRVPMLSTEIRRVIIEGAIDPGRVPERIIEQLASLEETPLELTARAHALNTLEVGEMDAMMDAIMMDNAMEPVQYMLSAVEHDHAVRALQFLWGARRGLSGEELRQLLNVDIEECDQLLEELDHLLVSRNSLYSFRHDQIRDVIRKRYITDADDIIRIHTSLGNYFSNHPDDLRRADEEPWQWKQVGDPKRLRQSIVDLDIFYQLSREGREYELLGYWQELGGVQQMTAEYRSAVNYWLANASRDVLRNRAAKMIQRLGTFFNASGAYHAAEYMLEQAERLFELHGGSIVDRARCMARHAETLRCNGRLGRACQLFSTACDLFMSDPSAPRAALAQALSDWGLALRDRGKYDEALVQYRKALRMKEQEFGRRHPSTAETLSDMALVYHDRQQHDIAILLYKEAIDIQEGASKGRDLHPAMATYLENLACIQHTIERPASAISNIMQALLLREILLSPQHPSTLSTKITLAGFLHARGEFDDAHALCCETQQEIVNALDEDHPHYLAASINLAQLKRALGYLEEAEALTLRTLGACLRILDDAHRYTAVCRQNLGGIYRELQKYDKAVEYYYQAAATWRIVFRPDHPNVATALHLCGDVLRITGQHVRALVCYTEALEIRTGEFGHAHGRTRRTFKHLIALCGEFPEDTIADIPENVTHTLLKYVEEHPDSGDEMVKHLVALLNKFRGYRR